MTERQDRPAATSREVILRGLHPSMGGATLWDRLDRVQRKMLVSELEKLPTADHDGADHEPGRLPYVCPRCALDAVLLILGGKPDA